MCYSFPANWAVKLRLIYLQTLRPAAIGFVFCVMMISLCDQYWQFMLAHGVLLGICNGFMIYPALTAVSQYFDKKRAAALGITIAGSSIGGVVLPILFSKLLNGTNLGFGWSLRIVGFVFLPILGFSCIVIRARLPPRTTAFLKPSAFKETAFTSLIVASFFLFLGMLTPLFFLPSYAVTRGVSPTLASYLLAIVNGASTFGRVIPGILADKFGKLNILAGGGIVTGIIICCFNLAESTGALIAYSVIFGLASGTLISGVSAAYTGVPKDPREMGTYLGMGLALSALATLIGPPINGKLVEQYGGFFEVSIFSGIVVLFGGFLALASKLTTPEGFWSRR
jgi:MFS family permease